MAVSMTGFGRGEAKGKWGTIVIEARSLNHRYLEVSSRLPLVLVSLEERIREHVSKKVKRGRITLSVSLDRDGELGGLIRVDEKRARRYYEVLLSLKKELDMGGEIRMEEILSLPDVVKAETTPSELEEIWSQMREALEKAMNQLVEMREAEGKVLTNDLLRRVALVEKELAKIAKRGPSALKHYRTRLLERVKELTSAEKVDRDRLEQEIVFFAENSDITEEVTRTKSHLETFQKALSMKEEVGRKLDFIAQELQREANTIGQKSRDFEISQSVIQMKGEIERMREQVQNVE
ncbi:MAG: YicC family protein [Candidatus Omnitrophica bacterium]|nr:YicC family protein [Candidatus Omnitrophota bacterium]